MLEGESDGAKNLFGSRYRILEHLGSGSFGEVLLAHDLHLDRRVAIKRLLPLTESAAVSRFEREARASGQVRHPLARPRPRGPPACS